MIITEALNTKEEIEEFCDLAVGNLRYGIWWTADGSQPIWASWAGGKVVRWLLGTFSEVPGLGDEIEKGCLRRITAREERETAKAPARVHEIVELARRQTLTLLAYRGAVALPTEGEQEMIGYYAWLSEHREEVGHGHRELVKEIRAEHEHERHAIAWRMFRGWMRQQEER
jgi:hypothetical protein